jgi:inner membrane protein
VLRSRACRGSILSAALHLAGGHRGPTHSLPGLGLTAAVGLLLRAMVIWWALSLGVLSHLMLDSLTWGGVPWLWPWKRHFRVPWAPHTGS